MTLRLTDLTIVQAILRLNHMKWRYFVKSYTKPTLVKLGSLALIKSNSTGPSTDGKKYSGFFK